MATKAGRSRVKGAQAREQERANDRPAHGPCTFVVFGGTGDLARRKILPALSRLRHNDLITDDTTILAVARDTAAGVPAGVVSARFHRALAGATARACLSVAAAHGLEVAVLSGGVFQNVRLLQATRARLEAAGLRVLVPERLPPNDGGVSYGQAAIAAARG